MNMINEMDNLDQIKDPIERCVQKYLFYTNLKDKKNGLSFVSPQLVIKAMADHAQVQVVLIGAYEKAKEKVFDLEEDLRVWWDEKFLEVKKEMYDDLLKEDKCKSLKISLKEIETQTRNKYEKDYSEKTKNIFKAKLLVSQLRRYSDYWPKFGTLLSNMSNNMRQELKAYYLEDNSIRENNNQNKVVIRKPKF